MPIKHTIKQGDGTASVAEQHGFFPRTVWNHADNAELKKKRRDMNVLMPGDVLVIPDRQAKALSGETEKRHRFKRKGVPAVFRLQVFDVEEPRVNQDYRLEIDGEVLEGRTDGNGVLEEYLPPGSRQGRLTIGPDHFECTIAFGVLDPADELTGVQKRLNNLGFGCGMPNGQLNGETRAALAEFQRRFGLPVTSRDDEATIRKLGEIHDKQSQFPEEPIAP